MTQKEFETRTGIVYVNGEFEDFVNPLYMACGDMDKDDFCKEYKANANKLMGSGIISYLMSEVETLRLGLENTQKQADKEMEMRITNSLNMADFLVEQAEKWSASDLREKAIELIGIKEYIRRKIEMGFNLWEADKEALKEILKQD